MLPKNWEVEEERKIVAVEVGHSAAVERAAVKIDAELRDEELVDAPAPAAAREQIEPSAAARDRVASWAAARRSIVLGCRKKKRRKSGDDDDALDEVCPEFPAEEKRRATLETETERKGCDALADRNCVKRAGAACKSVRVENEERKVFRMQKKKKKKNEAQRPFTLSSLSLCPEPLGVAASGPLLAPRFPLTL